jgi:hypothetical protein
VHASLVSGLFIQSLTTLCATRALRPELGVGRAPAARSVSQQRTTEPRHGSVVKDERRVPAMLLRHQAVSGHIR